MKLDQFLKWKGLASTGGEAKHLIRSGLVMVNGAVELKRGRKLKQGDSVSCSNYDFLVAELDTQGPRLESNDL